MTRCLTAVCSLIALPAAAQEADPTPRIAIMSAFEPEWEVWRGALSDAEPRAINGVQVVTGTLEGQEVVLVLSGISMVNAAMTTQMALDRFEIEAIVFSGIAGGVDPDLSIGDVVVPARWGSYLESYLAREADGEYVLPGFAETDFPNYDMIFPKPVQVVREGMDGTERRFWFETDATFLEQAGAVAEDLSLEGCVEGGACLDETPEIVVGGNGVSGMSFMDNADFRAYVFDTFEARVVDMESAAVAQVAWANDVPFVAFRSLSDLAGGGAGENEMETFYDLAAGNSARVVRALLARMD